MPNYFNISHSFILLQNLEYFSACQKDDGMHDNTCALNIHALNVLQGGLTHRNDTYILVHMHLQMKTTLL